MSDFWDEKNLSELDMLSEEIDEQAQKILDEFEEPEDEEEEYEEDEYEEEDEVMEDYKPTKGKVAYNLNRQESSVVNDATIRLEQARLYDMLIKHDMFKGVKANPSALANVKNELKTYIVSRLEILLGIRKEKPDRVEKVAPIEVEVDSPFNDVEIEFLKALSYKGTKGASAEAVSKKLKATQIQPLSSPMQVEEEEQGLSSLSSYDDEDDYEEEYEDEEEEYEDEEEEYIEPPKPKKKVLKKKPAPKPKAKKKPAPKRKVAKPAGEVEKYKPSRAAINRRGEMTDAEAERIAREDMERMKGRKSVSKMNETELLEANKRITTNAKKERPAGAKPIPDATQLNMHYQTQQANNSANPSASGFNVLLNKVLASKK